jgi:hypothetical protein
VPVTSVGSPENANQRSEPILLAQNSVSRIVLSQTLESRLTVCRMSMGSHSSLLLATIDSLRSVGGHPMILVTMTAYARLQTRCVRSSWVLLHTGIILRRE